MSLVPIDWRPTTTKLAQFSEVAMFVLGMVAAPLAYLRSQPILATVFWVAAVVCRLVGVGRPALLRPIYVGLSLLTWPIGWACSHVALAFVYYGVVTPIACLLRLAGRDPLTRRFNRNAITYWEPYNPDRGLDRYLKQF
jgi:hypothetical protein